MWEDEIVNEVHRVREEYAARFDYNLDAIYKDIKKREYLNRHKIVALAVKQDWPADVPEETQEDIDLLRAVKEGEEGGNVSREEVFALLRGTV